MSATRQSLIGAALPRKEDDRLLRGDGLFTDDVQLAHQLEMAVGRSPFPRAAIGAIDVSEARALPGVRHILTGADVRAASEPLTVLRPVPGAPLLPYYALAGEEAIHEGQPVVSVAATSRAIAEDALELIDIDYEPLPHVTDTLGALAADAPVLHPETLPSNLLTSNVDRAGEPESRMAAAPVVVEGRFRVNRVSALPMEGRGIVAHWRAGARTLEVHASTQTPHLIRQQLAECLPLDEGCIRVIASDVGGGFGMKLGSTPRVLAVLHAMALRRPVKWIEDRLEFFRASTQAREAVFDVRIGAEPDGRIVAITNRYTTDLGAWNSTYGSAQLSSVVFTGPYRVADAAVERRVALTNKTPIGAYRGYGQPEVNFALEVLLDRLARRLEIDPLELRRKNMLRPEDLPWTTPSRAVYDNGDYLKTLQMAADAVDYDTHRATRRQEPDGERLTGIGFASFVERTGYASARFLAGRGSRFGAHESVVLRANRSGGIDLYTGVSTFGQGSETAFAQVCAEVFGIDYEAITVHAGDSGASPLNTGAFASRTLIAAAGAIREAAGAMRDKTLRIAAMVLQSTPDALEVSGRVVRVSGEPGRSVPLADIFTRAIIGQGIPEDEEPGLEAAAHFEPSHASFSFGTAAAVVSVDPESGEFDVECFVMAHDCGVVVNPPLVEGQVRGGLVQGLGAALAEELRYDASTGQLVSGSMLDYFAPTIMDVPPIDLLHTEIPSAVTPFGVRGVGEAGTIPPAAAVTNAVCDALADYGVEISTLPLTPERVWRALAAAAKPARPKRQDEVAEMEYPARGRYANAALSPLEDDAMEWLDGFYQLEHLIATRMWAIKICPEASPEVKFAALTHDAERFFPGGPSSTPTNGFDDPDYLFAHSTRSANIVEEWLRSRTPAPDEAFIRRVRRLILRHEIGGGWEADFVQAADSLSFLETLDWITVDWVRDGRYTIAQAREKLDFTVERIRPSVAVAAALPLYESAVRALDAAEDCTMDLKQRRKLASSRGFLFEPPIPAID